MTFGTRLHAAIEARGPFCVGIDPHSALLLDWGLTDDVAGLETFALTVVEAVAPYVSVVKPQSAFYQRFGSRGIAVLERVLAESRAAGALTLLDVKRGDIGSTSQAYADAYLDQSSPLAADAVTVSPYLGFGSWTRSSRPPAVNDAGLFVLALTSDKEGPEVQHARTDDGGSVAGLDARPPAPAQRGCRAARLLRAVIGHPSVRLQEDFDFNGPILAPGFGAQGGTGRRRTPDLRGSAVVLPSSSREVLRAGPDKAAMREAAQRGQRRTARVRRLVSARVGRAPARWRAGTTGTATATPWSEAPGAPQRDRRQRRARRHAAGAGHVPGPG